MPDLFDLLYGATSPAFKAEYERRFGFSRRPPETELAFFTPLSKVRQRL
jgi:hypothetical protein